MGWSVYFIGWVVLDAGLLTSFGADEHRVLFDPTVSDGTDTLETYWDSRMDLLERRIKSQSERLKSRANEHLAKIKTPSGDKYARDIENEVKRFKVKVAARMASLNTAWQSAKVIRTREKVMSLPSSHTRVFEWR